MWLVCVASRVEYVAVSAHMTEEAAVEAVKVAGRKGVEAKVCYVTEEFVAEITERASSSGH